MKKICPLCGTKNEEDIRFCKECNIPLYDFKKEEVKKIWAEARARAEKKRRREEDKKIWAEARARAEKERRREEDKKIWAEARARAEKEKEEIKEKRKIEEQKLVKVLRAKYEKVFNDNISANESIDVKLQINNAEAIVVTDRRVMIIKGGIFSGAGLFGIKYSSFNFNQITSVNFRLGVLEGHIQLTVPGNTDIKGKTMKQAENAVTFPIKYYKERMKYIADLIRERAYTSQNPPHILKNTLGTGLVDQINELAKLKQQGIISEEEFQIVKRKLLS